MVSPSVTIMTLNVACRARSGAILTMHGTGSGGEIVRTSFTASFKNVQLASCGYVGSFTEFNTLFNAGLVSAMQRTYR
jgi:hypothetical protein